MSRLITRIWIHRWLWSATCGFALALALSTGATALASGGTEGESTSSKSVASADGASIAVADCVECHDETSLQHTPHVALDREDLVSSLTGASSSCTACHTGATEHMATEGEGPIFSFAGSPAENSQVCLGCHSDNHSRFANSDHAKAGLDCLDCHDSHAREPREASALFDLGDRPSATCAECHNTVFAQFGATERGHRIEEGVLECTSCHNPHERSARVALGGFKQQQCAQCHVDKNGPWVFEHPAGRTEGCASCHSPHGSPNRHMLNFQAVAEQCYSCHAVVPGFHTRFTEESQCTSCHSQIHGSNLHPAFLQ